MVVTIRTAFAETVREIIKDEEIFDTFVPVGKSGTVIVMKAPDDTQYPLVRSWASDAFGCGLIYGFQIDRI